MTKEKFVELSKLSVEVIDVKEEGKGVVLKESADEIERIGEEAQFLADSLFRVFDEDNSGAMDFSEYILALYATRLDSPQDKLKWIFNVFDKDGGGTIDREEISSMVKGLFSMAQTDVDTEEIKDCCDEIITAIDKDGDGEITREEFVENAMKSVFISNMLCGADGEDT